MPAFADVLISALLVLAGAFGLIGSYGLLKLTDPMARLHAPTKATTLGVGGVLVASMTWFWAVEGRVSFHELLITLFLFATAPVTAHLLAKMHIHRTLDQSRLPPTGHGTPWATFPGAADTARPPIIPPDTPPRL
jgi:multicomponent K+:H+ antiporter subunit G